jgi:hypothetical protein
VTSLAPLPEHDGTVLPASGPVESRRGRGRGGLLLALSLVLALVFVATYLTVGDAEVDDRERGLAEIESVWRERLADADAALVYRTAADRLDRWQSLLRLPVSLRWRLVDQPEPTERPPAPPRGIGASIDPESAAVVVTWEPTEDADQVLILRSVGEGESSIEKVADALAGRFEDEVEGLRGTYRYRLRSRRGSRAGPSSSPAIEVSFRIDARLALVGVDVAQRTARISVGPTVHGPRPARFVRHPFVVRVGDTVGTTVQGFDYRTDYRLTHLEERETEEMVDTEVPVFNPDGTRRRDPAGEPVTKVRKFPRRVTRVIATLEGEGLETLRLRHPE